MKRPIYFCKSWFRAKKKPIEIWSEDHARLIASKKQSYTVLVDSVESPYCFIEVSVDVVAVGFLDDFLRESLTYVFQEVEGKKLFLTMATYREFDGDTDTLKSGTTYFFDQNGKVKIKRENFAPHYIERSDLVAEVVFNYENMPEFGEYDGLIRVERHGEI